VRKHRLLYELPRSECPSSTGIFASCARLSTMSRVIPSSRPHASAGCRAGLLGQKRDANGAFRQMRLPIEEDAVEGTCSDRFRLARMLFKKLVALIWARARWAGPSRFGRRSGSHRYGIVQVGEGEAVGHDTTVGVGHRPDRDRCRRLSRMVMRRYASVRSCPTSFLVMAS